MSGEGVLRPVRKPPPLTSEQREAKNTDDLSRVTKLVSGLQAQKYFGKITLHIEGGTITRIQTEQMLKLDDL